MKTNENLQDRKIVRGLHTHPPKSDEFFLFQAIKTGIKRRISNPSERPQKAIDITIKDVHVKDLDSRMLKQFLLQTEKSNKKASAAENRRED